MVEEQSEELEYRISDQKAMRIPTAVQKKNSPAEGRRGIGQ
jgi:hypothetical protein